MILGERVQLRAIERADIPTFVRWFNDPEVTENLAITLPLSAASEERWFESRLDDRESMILAIETRAGVHIGNIGLHHIDTIHRHAELGIAIGEKAYWGQGYGRDAIRTLCRFGFQTMNLHRIYLSVYEGNERAQRCYRAVGFTHEGTLRQARFARGGYHDVHIMGLLRHEFEAQEQP